MVTPEYAVTGWRKAFRIVVGEHLKSRVNVLEPGYVRELRICQLLQTGSDAHQWWLVL
jgi:hypothetical protein